MMLGRVRWSFGWAAGAAAIACLVGCADSSDPGLAPTPSEDDRVALRERLRGELGDTYDDPIAAADGATLVRGAKLYNMLCEGCHGLRGSGDGTAAKVLAEPPPDLSDPAVASFLSDRARLEVIRKGIPGTPMIGWGPALGEGDLMAVFAYTRSLTEAGTGDGDSP